MFRKQVVDKKRHRKKNVSSVFICFAYFWNYFLHEVKQKFSKTCQCFANFSNLSKANKKKNDRQEVQLNLSLETRRNKYRMAFSHGLYFQATSGVAS